MRLNLLPPQSFQREENVILSAEMVGVTASLPSLLIASDRATAIGRSEGRSSAHALQPFIVLSV
jgi:hypothetical protein